MPTRKSPGSSYIGICRSRSGALSDGEKTITPIPVYGRILGGDAENTFKLVLHKIQIISSKNKILRVNSFT